MTHLPLLDTHDPPPLSYLVIGHICADLQPDGSTRPGGTALYAARAAARLGLALAVTTACAEDVPLDQYLAGICWQRQPSATTTIFENRYRAGRRTQRVHARAATIDLAAVPADWRRARVVHLAPIINEVPADSDFGALFPQSRVAVTPQGWLRAIDSSGRVHATPALLSQLPLRGVQIAILSEEDIAGDESLAIQLARRVPLVVLTRAERGAIVFERGRTVDVPALRANVVDPTGAGDVFAAAFLSALSLNHDPIEAAWWGCAAAAFAIEAPGVDGLADRPQLLRRLRDRAALI